MQDEFEVSNPEENVNSQSESGEFSAAAEPIFTQSEAQEPAEAQKPRKEKVSPYADSPYASADSVRRPEPTQRSCTDYGAPKKTKKGGAGRFFKRLGAFVLVAAMIAGSCFATAQYTERRLNSQINALNTAIDELKEQVKNVSAPVIGGNTAIGDYMTPAQVYALNADKVVSVTCTIRTSVMGRVTQGTASGSGFILTDNGFIVTNFHVVENATEITVTTHDGVQRTATMVGKDSINDTALLKVNAEGLNPVTLGTSTELAIGDMVVAIGNPLGTLNAAQTVGYVSGKDRRITTDNTVINMLQTDVAINSGNSGGPLFNMYGEVVGITTAKYSGTTSSGVSIEGISFAIPIDDVKSGIADLMAQGYISSGYLGVIVNNVDSKTAAMYNLPSGAYVSTVNEGSCAEKAGIQVKDIITAVGGTTVTNITDLNRALRGFKAGDETTVTIYRNGQSLDLAAVLDEKPQEDSSDAKTHEGAPSEGSYDEWYEYFNRFFGLP